MEYKKRIYTLIYTEKCLLIQNATNITRSLYSLFCEMQQEKIKTKTGQVIVEKR